MTPKKTIISTLCLIFQIIFLSPHLLAADHWQPDSRILETLVQAPIEDMEYSLSSLVRENEREDYAIHAGQVLLFQLNEVSKSEAYFNIADTEMSNRGITNGSFKLRSLQMSIAISRDDHLNIIQYGEDLLHHLTPGLEYSIQVHKGIRMALSAAYSAVGKFEYSMRTLEALIPMIEHAGDTAAKTELYFNLAETAYKLSHPDATKFAEQLFEIALEIGDNSKLGDATKLLGNIHMADSKVVDALKSYTKAIIYYGQVNDTHGIANCKFNLGLLMTRIQDWERAIAYFEEASFNFMESGSPGGAGMAKMQIGRTYTRMEQYENAARLFKESRTLLTKIKSLDRLNQLTTYENALKDKM